MEAGCCRNRVRSGKVNLKNRCVAHEAHQASRVWSLGHRAILIVSFSFLPGNLLAQSCTGPIPELVHGSIVGAQGQAVTDATVEIRDLHGIERGRSRTDAAGSFAIRTMVEPGQYFVVAGKALQVSEKRIALTQADVEVRIELPPAPQTTAPQPFRYSVSAKTLSVPEKAWGYVRSAQREFSEGNLAAASVEIDRSLQIDSHFARAFSMRALLKLALRDASGAAADAEHAVSMDPLDGGAYLVLGTAYNSLHEFEKAEQAERQALGLDPVSWQAQLELAKSWYGRGQFVLALRELDLLNRDFPDVHLLRGNVLTHLGRGQEAAQEFALFLEQAPKDPRTEQIKRIIAAVHQVVRDTNSAEP